jgi:hypothetical protein
MFERHHEDRRHPAVTRPSTAAAWGLGLMLYPLGSRRTGRAALVRHWYTKSSEVLDATYDAWFDPAVVGVIDTLVGNGEIGVALDDYFVARSAAGFSLAETATDLSCLIAVTPPRLRVRLQHLDLPRLLALGWPEPTDEVVAGAPALGALAARVRAACGRVTPRIGDAAGPTLLVIDGDRDDRDRLAVAASRWIEELFPAAEMLGVVTPGRFLAVVHSHPVDPDPADLLAVVLKASPGGATAAVRSEVWPDDVDDALALVSQLTVPEPAGVLEPAAAAVVPIGAAASAARRAGRIARDARAWTASGIAAAIAVAVSIAGGAGGRAHIPGQAALAPPAAAATPAPVTTPAAAAPVSVAASQVSRAAVTHPAIAKPPTTPPAPPTPPAGGPDDSEQRGPGGRPFPDPVSLPIGEPPSLGQLETQVQKVERQVFLLLGQMGLNGVTDQP